MNILERLAVSVRRASPVSPDHVIWRTLRPLYRGLLVQTGSNGLERRINATDSIRVLPELYNVGETYEPEVWSQVMRELQPADTVVDVGASFGLYTLAIARRLGDAGRVISFEADPGTVDLLKRMVDINRVDSRVVVHACAVGDSPGSLRFVMGHGLESHIATDADPDAVEVPVVRLDDVLETTRVDLLKVDVEGYELHVLRGATRLLSDPERAPRALFVEVHPFAWDGFGVTSDALLQLLSSCGYEVSDLAGRAVEKIQAYGEVIARKR